MRLRVFSLSFALIAASHAVVPRQAEAASALFSVTRSWGGYVTFTLTYPTTTGYVGTTVPQRFTVPQSAIKETDYTYTCTPGPFGCYPPFYEQTFQYSSWNLKGSFGPNNPHAPTAPVTVRRRTVSDGWPGPPTVPATGTKTPVVATTTFSGRYSGSRFGSIMVTPGGKRFGGTMRFFYGPNHKSYGRMTTGTLPNYVSSTIGVGPPNLTTYDASQVAEYVDAGHVNRYRQTYTSYSKRMVVGSTIPSYANCASGYGGTVRPPTNPGCEYYVRKIQNIDTIVPFTTGMVTGWMPVGPTTITVHTLTGYDNRTPNGHSGVISLVNARLRHNYLREHEVPLTTVKQKSWLSSWRTNFEFKGLPEPGLLLQLASGLLGLAILDRCRRSASR